MKADQLQDMLLTLRFEMQRSFGLPGLLGVLVIGVAAIVAVSTFTAVRPWMLYVMIGIATDSATARKCW